MSGVEIVMPYVSETMTEGTVRAWLVEPGARVAVGDDLVEIDTDKVTVVHQSDTPGTLSKIVVGPGETVPVGSVIAWVTP